ncbi:hypothetical protein GCM10022255_079460 [Dactylosporangium darangshiense]|uniref:Uncharacterized protein n=1 Tax=Dactylosporangium darangshiense TaxID=579108 RepID=A0ABP8DLC2_9ACTN
MPRRRVAVCAAELAASACGRVRFPVCVVVVMGQYLPKGGAYPGRARSTTDREQGPDDPFRAPAPPVQAVRTALSLKRRRTPATMSEISRALTTSTAMAESRADIVGAPSHSVLAGI